MWSPACERVRDRSIGGGGPVGPPLLQKHYGGVRTIPPESTAVIAIRLTASIFILILIGLTAMGWVWTGTHQPAAQAAAARIVLALAALAGIGGLVALWRWPGRT